MYDGNPKYLPKKKKRKKSIQRVVGTVIRNKKKTLFIHFSGNLDDVSGNTKLYEKKNVKCS